MEMNLSEGLKVLCAEAGIDQDLAVLMSDEHERYGFYLRIIALAPPPDDRALLSVVLRDPDRVMGEAAAVEFTRKQAEQHSSHQSFVAWTNTVADLTDDRDFLSRRIREWAEYKFIMEGGCLDHAFFEGSSDWLQRKLSEELTSSDSLAELAEFGRTKRIRNFARQRLEQMEQTRRRSE